MKWIALPLMVLGAALPWSSYAEQNEVNLYSARKAELIEPLLEKFTAESGIKVNLVTGKDDALLQRLKSEGELSPADMLITADAARLQRAKDAGLFQSIDSEVLNQRIPAHLRDSTNQWFGLSQRARVIFYDPAKVKPEQLSTYEALADDQWQGRVCIRSSSNVYNQSLVAAMIDDLGAERTQTWANNFMDSFARPPAGGDTDQIRALGAGQCDVAVANTYYYGRMLKSDGKDKAIAESVALFWPNQDGRGTHVNVSGAGVTQSAKNKAEAIKLLEFLVSERAQQWYAEVNNEFPVVQGVALDPVVAAWGEFKADDVPLNTLGENNQQAVKIMDRAGWR
ncbi:Fe(3+) ABC transporter substrate-binding protein [Bacterioplanes sanyensis]|uniref:Fe(3+) ABC transporter substrate-binding protein n=1 Tax=Bacterioplanes sanyensis TaxID=1249553 RepID=A0A222FKA0_9GAMM|nr:Fe(3+) ABC transporter substrate-binding protein [Bacterioplanes sanyensis]ASP39455.1 Fe(3+) ABC transporter substrate-binding protein [Bacterioplanes sanyensis]